MEQKPGVAPQAPIMKLLHWCHWHRKDISGEHRAGVAQAGPWDTGKCLDHLYPKSDFNHAVSQVLTHNRRPRTELNYLLLRGVQSWLYRRIGRKEVLVTQLPPTLGNPMDWSLPGSSLHWILQARILEWVAIPFSGASSQLRDRGSVSCIAGGFFTIWATKEAIQTKFWRMDMILMGYVKIKCI